MIPLCYISIALISDILKYLSCFCQMSPNCTLYSACSYFLQEIYTLHWWINIENNAKATSSAKQQFTHSSALVYYCLLVYCVFALLTFFFKGLCTAKTFRKAHKLLQLTAWTKWMQFSPRNVEYKLYGL